MKYKTFLELSSIMFIVNAYFKNIIHIHCCGLQRVTPEASLVWPFSYID